ncbi:MAG TPA: response regulator, partial [Candidatus Paceibacterota bacterium]
IKLPITDTISFGFEPGSSENVGRMAHRVMVVDDNVQAADSLVKLLNNLGCRAEAVYSGEELLRRVEPANLDIILLDIGMPHMDGYKVIQSLRARGIPPPPVVALTGYGLIEDKEKALAAGFTAHLTKPVGIKELREMFKRLLPVAAT